MKMQRNNEFKCEERWGIMQNRHSSHTCSVCMYFIPHKLQGCHKQGNCVNFKYSTSKRCRGLRSTRLMSLTGKRRSEGDESGSVWAFCCGCSHEPNQARRALVDAAKRAVNACQGLKATLGWQLTISSENPSDLALRVSVEEEMTSTPVAA